MAKAKFILFGIDAQSGAILLNSAAQKFGVNLKADEPFLSVDSQNLQNLNAFLGEVKGLFGDKFLKFQNLAKTAMQILKKRGLKISCAESCTGGLLTYEFTKNAGASDVLDGCVVSYANHIKSAWLDVSESDLANFGAVSEQVVRQMCAGALHLSGADFALATSGIAGPGGATPNKPVGLVFIGVQRRGGNAIIERHIFKGNRVAVQKQAVQTAILMLLRELNGSQN